MLLELHRHQAHEWFATVVVPQEPPWDLRRLKDSHMRPGERIADMGERQWGEGILALGTGVSRCREVKKTSVGGGKNICRAAGGDEAGKGAWGQVLCNL